MRWFISVLLLVTLLLAGNYWYGSLGLVCKLPVTYNVGEIDKRFGLSEATARSAAAQAEAVWEDALGRDDIFAYDETSSLHINFIYDERQATADAASKVLADLDTREEANDVLVELHSQLLKEYKNYETTYQNQRQAYETSLAEYNAEVEKYNSTGGAPAEVYDKLEERRRELDQERKAINELADQLNELSERINLIGEKGNELIGEYNRRVRQFNDSFVHEHEFTQGDYRSREINIYTFNSERELMLVLAHELGHSLALDHTENEASIMYYLMGKQANPPTLTEEDKQAFKQACDQDFIHRLFSPFLVLYNSLINSQI